MNAAKIIYQGKTKKGHGILIRYPAKGDLRELQKYINALSKEQTFIVFQGEHVTLKDERKYLSDQLKKIAKKEAVKLIALRGKEIIGISDITMQEKVEKHIGVFGITVARKFRGEGIGKLLMGMVLKEAKKNLPKLKIVKLGIFANNDLAMTMYKQFGFKEFGRLPKGILYKDGAVDHIYMYREI